MGGSYDAVAVTDFRHGELSLLPSAEQKISSSLQATWWKFSVADCRM